MSELEKYFEKFRKNIVGINQEFESPYGIRKIIYGDWIASGRLYKPIEKKNLGNNWPVCGEYAHRNQRDRDTDDPRLPPVAPTDKKTCQCRAK